MTTIREYVAVWPITDDTMRLSELKAEAAEDLATLAERDNVVIFGQPHIDISDDGRSIVAKVQVRPIDPGLITKPAGKEGTTARRAREVLDLLDIGLTVEEIAARIGISIEACGIRLKRAGYPIEARPFMAEVKHRKYEAAKTKTCECGALIHKRSSACASCNGRIQLERRRAA